MRLFLKRPVTGWFEWGALLLALVFAGRLHAGQFVQLTAEIETTFWSSEGMSSFYRRPSGDSRPPRAYTVHCVVSTNRWRMNGSFLSQNADVTWWFTGSNLVSQTLFQSGAKSVQKYESADGNPSKPKGEADLLELPGRIAWLAFCSGPCLKRAERRLLPLNNFWKEFIDAPSGFTDNRWFFNDTLGLPEAFSLYTAGDQPMVQYRVTTSTNLLGWHFPLNFAVVEYRPALLTHGMELDFIATGRVTQIEAVTEQEFQRQHATPSAGQ